MSLQNLVIGVVALIALALGGVAYMGQDNRLSAIPGSDVLSHIVFQAGLTDGGERVSVTPVTATVTLTSQQMNRAKIITFAASTTQAALTATLPASTTFPLTRAGDYRTWVIENPFTAAATTTTIAAGTGVDLQEPDGQNVVIGINNYVFLTCVKGADSGAPQDVVCSVDETIPAD